MARLRYLVRLANERDYKPPDWRSVSTAASEAIQDLGANVGAIRVGSKVVGLHLFIEKEDQLNDALDRLGSSVGKVIDHRRLDVPLESKPKEVMIQDAKEMFNDERFWECHEILEKLWMDVGGREALSPEVKLLQGMVLIAAAFVHHQRAEDDIALNVLRRAKKKMDLWQDDQYLSLNISAMKGEIDRILDSGQVARFLLT